MRSDHQFPLKIQSGETVDPKTPLDKINQTDERELYPLAEDGIPEVIGLGSLKYRKSHPPLPEHNHPDAIELHLCLSGAARFDIEGEGRAVLPGMICLTQPRMVHRLATIEKRQEHFWMMLSMKPKDTKRFLALPPAEAEFLVTRLKSIDRITFTADSEVESLLREAIGILQHQPRGIERTLRLRSLLTRILLKITDSATGHEANATSASLTSVIKSLTEHPEQRTSITQLAQQAKMSESYFIHAFKTATGLTPNAFRTSERIKLAKKLLTETSLRLTDIAYAAGFASSAHFSTVFRHETGQTPSELRTYAAGLADGAGAREADSWIGTPPDRIGATM